MDRFVDAKKLVERERIIDGNNDKRVMRSNYEPFILGGGSTDHYRSVVQSSRLHNSLFN